MINYRKLNCGPFKIYIKSWLNAKKKKVISSTKAAWMLQAFGLLSHLHVAYCVSTHSQGAEVTAPMLRYWSLDAVWSWPRPLSAASSLLSSGRWRTKANTPASHGIVHWREISWEPSAVPPTNLCKHRQDCIPLVSIHFFHWLVVRLRLAIIQIV